MMSKYVNVASVLYNAQIEANDKNKKELMLAHLAGKLNCLEGYGLDLVVFSEGIESRGQDLDDAEQLDHPGPFLQAYIDFAKREQCHVAGSIKLTDGTHVYNSIAFIDDSGKALGAYHKVNLTMGELEKGLTPGNQAVCVDSKIGRLGGAICFDLNFESLRQDYKAAKPDIIVFPSMYHGGLVQQMWAYDCRSFFISALPFIGGGILDPFGQPLALTDCYSTVAKTRINLDRAMVHLDFNRDKFPDIEQKYKDKVNLHIPPNIGPALIYSESDEFTAMDIVNEFELELMDDYMTRSATANAEVRPT